MPRRPDATLVKTSKFREIEFHVMPGRNESIIYYDQQIDLTNTFKFIEEYNKNREKDKQVTLFQVFIAACVRNITLLPKVNRFVSNRRLWQRNQILISFVVKQETKSGPRETTATIEFDPFDTITNVQEKVYRKIHKARGGEHETEKDISFFGAMPRWLIRLLFWFGRLTEKYNMPINALVSKLPMFCTYFVANLGSLGIDSVFHHLYELGNAGVFLNIGKYYKGAVVNQETLEIEVKDVLNLRISLDDRFAGGVYTAPVVILLRDLIENPKQLLEPPKLTDEHLDKLMLKKYKTERLAREKQRKKEKR